MTKRGRQLFNLLGVENFYPTMNLHIFLHIVIPLEPTKMDKFFTSPLVQGVPVDVISPIKANLLNCFWNPKKYKLARIPSFLKKVNSNVPVHQFWGVPQYPVVKPFQSEVLAPVPDEDVVEVLVVRQVRMRRRVSPEDATVWIQAGLSAVLGHCPHAALAQNRFFY